MRMGKQERHRIIINKKKLTGHTKTNEIHKFMPQRDESSHVFGRHQTT